MQTFLSLAALAQAPHAPKRKPPRMRDRLPGARTARVLSFTSKLMCPSFGMTAGIACPASHLMHDDPLAPCHPKNCYAKNTTYMWAEPKDAYALRFQWVTRCMRTAEGREEFITTMIRAIRYEVDRNVRRGNLKRFRIHDSGDFISPAYVECWIEIATVLSDIPMWAPAQSHRLPKILAALVPLNALPNVAISPSGDHFDGAMPVVEGLSGGSVVATLKGGALERADLCPAFAQGGYCGDCMKCYRGEAKAYILHADVHEAKKILLGVTL